MSEQQSAPARALYERVEEIRLTRGWSKVRLARELQMNRGTIENWRTQPRSPQTTTVKEVADRLGIPYREALSLAGIVAAEVSAALPSLEVSASTDDDIPEELRQREGEGGFAYLDRVYKEWREDRDMNNPEDRLRARVILGALENVRERDAG
ncbi:helix-turn-helix domain-containing protein [Spirillospora sp. CA-253888]